MRASRDADNPNLVARFYDSLAPWYHLVYQDWEASIRRQADALRSLFEAEWGSVHRVFDAAIGVGTQALGLAALGYDVRGSDISLAAVRRASDEARARGVRLACSVGDLRALAVRSESIDVVLACDNALPHLLTETEIGRALSEMFRCLRPRGGCVISLRDYGRHPPTGTVETVDYGDRNWAGQPCRLRQVWRWDRDCYDIVFEVLAKDPPEDLVWRSPTTRYLAVALERVAALMRAAGFANMRRVDGCLFQPVLVGTR